jgi:predicted cupin superfamily sugar epimerase
MNERARDLVQELGLEPHPEGGFYRQIFKSDAIVNPVDDRDARAALTAIYFLLAAGQHSRWHRVASDEIWTHLEGAPIVLWQFEGHDVEQYELGRRSPVVVVPRLVWQAAEVLGDYALVACFVAPGFEFSDFSLMSDDANARRSLERMRSDLLRLVS